MPSDSEDLSLTFLVKGFNAFHVAGKKRSRSGCLYQHWQYQRLVNTNFSLGRKIFGVPNIFPNVERRHCNTRLFDIWPAVSTRHVVPWEILYIAPQPGGPWDR